MKPALIFILLFFLIISCNVRKDKEQNPAADTPVQKKEKKISIHLAGSLSFIRSYSFIQSLSLSDKEKDKLFEETSKSNPLLISEPGNDTVLKKKFEVYKIVADDRLLIDKLKYNTNPDFTLTGPGNETIKGRIEKDTISGDNTRIIVFSKGDSSQTKAAIYFDLKYFILDIIPGSYKEVVILNEHYLSNTELYYLDVYEMKVSR